MTTYVTIASARRDAESPIDTTLIDDLYQNPTSDDAPLSAAAGASKILLATLTASASATLDFTTGIDSTYPFYTFEFDAVLPATDNTTLRMRVSTDGGSTFISSSVYDFVEYGEESGGGSISDNVSSQAFIDVAGTTIGVGNAADEGLSGFLTMCRPYSTTFKKRFFGTFGYTKNTATIAGSNMAGSFNTGGTDVDAVRFYYSSGNIVSGVVRMYGHKI